MSDPLDQRCIDTLRFLAVDMVQKADSGHPGLPLGAAPMAYVLWQRFLRHHPAAPEWSDRDRFVLSAGHGSALLYALLHTTGYDLSLDDLRQFRQWGSRTPGHPERGHTPGVEVTTGPLGQGLANAVGLAIAEAQLAARYNRDGHAIIDHRTWVIASDGDLMEGVGNESASLAGHLRLGKLNVLYDDNRVTLAAGTEVTFSEDRAGHFEALGWHVQRVADGNDVEAIAAALQAACDETARPSLVAVRTHIGYGSPVQDSYKAHGSPLGEDGVRRTKQALDWPTEPDFLIPDDAAAHLRTALERGASLERDWNDRFRAYAQQHDALAAELERALHAGLPDGWDGDIPVFPADPQGLATREASGRVMDAIAAKLPQLTGGSADLDPSTKTCLDGLGDFQPATPAGRNLHFGVREHAMGAIANGMAAHGGCLPFTATFLIFSDYMRPPMRLAALSALHVIHVFTHDSIALGEDGPTHQPVEQLANLRAVPNMLVIRPCDANETAEAWRVAVQARSGPVSLVLTRQKVPTLDRSRYAGADGLRHGAYVLDAGEGRGSDDADDTPALILIATGSEVQLILEAADRLRADGIAVRCVSMPSWELFEAQSPRYREQVLPSRVSARLAVEAGSPQGWHRYIGDAGGIIAVTTFGASAPGATNLEQYGFSVENVVARAKAIVER